VQISYLMVTAQIVFAIIFVVPFVSLFLYLLIIIGLVTLFPDAPFLFPLELYGISFLLKAIVISLAVLNFALAYVCEHSLFPRLIKEYQQFVQLRMRSSFTMPLAEASAPSARKMKQFIASFVANKERKLFKIITEEMNQL